MGLKDLSDGELVKRLREGEQKALSILYERYAGLVYSIAYKILGNQQEAEDLTQDIFVNFWKSDRFDTERGTLSTFLGLLTRCRALDKQRSRKTAQNFLIKWQKLTTEETGDLLPLERASQEERQMKLKQALKQLPELQAQILEMNYLEGLSQAQIATALNLTLGTVKSRSRQGLVQLKKILSDL